MRVVHLDSGLHLRGGQQQLILLAKMLRTYAVEQRIVLRRGNDWSHQIHKLGIPFSELPFNSEMDCLSMLKLHRLLRNFSADIVHAHDARTLGVVALPTLLYPQVRIIAARRVAFPLKKNPFTRLKYGRISSRVVAVSRYIRDALCSSGLDPRSISVVHDGVEFEKSDPFSRVEARRNLQLSDEDFVIGCVGHFSPEKGHSVLIRGIAGLIAAFPNVRLLLVGDGLLKAEYEVIIRNLNLEETVILPGFIEDLSEIWPAMDLFVFPSLTEGLGSSLLMAMARGIPVCASRTGGIPEIVVAETGYLFAPGDVGSLTTCLHRALSEPRETRGLGEAGRERIRQQFSATKMAEETYQIYTNVLRV